MKYWYRNKRFVYLLRRSVSRSVGRAGEQFVDWTKCWGTGWGGGGGGGYCNCLKVPGTKVSSCLHFIVQV